MGFGHEIDTNMRTKLTERILLPVADDKSRLKLDPLLRFRKHLLGNKILY